MSVEHRMTPPTSGLLDRTKSPLTPDQRDEVRAIVREEIEAARSGTAKAEINYAGSAVAPFGGGVTPQ